MARKYIYFFDDPTECLKVIREAMEKQVESEELSYLAFDSCMLLSQYQEAIKFLDLIKPDNHKTDLMALKSIRAIALMESGDYIEAIDLLTEIIENDLKNEVGYLAHFLLVCSYFRSGESQKALSVFSDISLEYDQANLSLTLIPLGMFDCSKYLSEAIEYVLQTSADLKTTATAKGFRAMYLYGKLSEAEVSISKIDVSHIDLNVIENDLLAAVNFFPENIKFNWTLGEILYKTNKWFDSARYLIKAQLISDEDEYININALEKIYGNKSRLNKFFQMVNELLEDYSPYEKKFAKFLMSNIVLFLFDKKDYKTVIEFTNRFQEGYWVKEKILFIVAYSHSMTGDKKLAKKYYKEYLNTIGENQAVLNNLGNIFSEEGDYPEAEKLYARAMELGAEYAEKNLSNLNKKKQIAESGKQSLQRAVTLYAQETKSMRRIVAHMYESRLDGDLILFKLATIAEYLDGDVNLLLRNLTDKKYFEIVDEHNLPFDGVVLCLNSLLTEHVQKELRDEQSEKFFDNLSSSISAHNLREKFNYDEKLVSKLTILHSQELRNFLERDLMEAVLSLVTQSYKAAIILCGSIVEAVLLDRLLPNKDSAMEALKKVRQRQNKTVMDREKKIENWDLESLLDVAFEEKIISYNLFYWGNGIRGFRNLVHPGVERRKGKELSVSKENAEISWSIVKRLLDEIQ